MTQIGNAIILEGEQIEMDAVVVGRIVEDRIDEAGGIPLSIQFWRNNEK